jgi:hypothetical protein
MKTKTQKTNELSTEDAQEAMLYVLNKAPAYVRDALKQFMAAMALWTLTGDAPALSRIKHELDARNAAQRRAAAKNGGAQ